MPTNKITINNVTRIDLSTTGIESSDDIPEGKIGYLRTGERVVGTGEIGMANPLKGKIAVFTGDSICYGASYTGGYASIIGEENDMTVQNLGQNNRCIASYDNNTGIWASVADMRSDADYIILEGGVNDAGYNVPLGSITSGYDDTLDTDTFAGAFEQMLKSTILKFPGKKIGFVFITKTTPNFDSRTPNSHYTVAIECCEKWGIPYCNLNVLSPPLRYISALESVYTTDGIHPSEDGYRAYYVPKITAWMKTL